MRENLRDIVGQQFDSIIEGFHDGFLIVDDCGNVCDANRTYCDMVGYSKNELLDMQLYELRPDMDEHEQQEKINEWVTKGGVNIEVHHKAKNGSDRLVEINSSVIKHSESQKYLAAWIRDLTQEKELRGITEKSRQQFESLFKHNPHAVFSMDLDGNFEILNKALEKLTGYTADELKDRNFEPMVAPEFRDRVKNKFETAANGKPQTYESVGIHKDGTRYEVKVTNLPIYIDGNVEGVFGIARDVTEENRAKRQLKESEQRWEQLVRENPQPIQITQDAKITFINSAGVKLYGAESKEELIGRSVYEFSDPDKIENIKRRKNRLENGQPVEEVLEHKINCLNGDERYVKIYSIPTIYNDKATIQSVIYDVTEQVKKEQRIKESLDEKETLLREIHHRVKNNLAVISGLLELQAMTVDDSATVNILRDSQQRIKSMAMIHEKLYESEALADIGFDRYLRELVESIRQTYSSVEYEVDISYDLDTVSLELEEAIPCSLIVNEVVVNCYKHAFKFAKRGTITIKSVFEEPNLEITIEDDGCGLPGDFDIESQDTLGMNLIQTLATQLEGIVEFESGESNNGTIFKLNFSIS
jgi:PAS domain S-box-containing protein